MKTLFAGIVLVLAPAFAMGAQPEKIHYPVLSAGQLGPIRLQSDVILTDQFLQKSFPDYSMDKVYGPCGVGGAETGWISFNFSYASEQLFTLSGEITNPKECRADRIEKITKVPWTQISIVSPKIKDVYGVHVGMNAQELMKTRGNALAFSIGPNGSAEFSDGAVVYTLKNPDWPGAKSFATQEEALQKNWTITALSLTSQPATRAVSKKHAALSPQALVSKLYDAHKSKKDPLSIPADPNILSHYFTERLTGLLIQNQLDANSEINRLGIDLIYHSPKDSITNFRVREPLMTMDGATVAVNFANAGLAHQVKFFLTETMQGWRIYDIRYEDGTSLHSILEKKL